MKTLENIAVVHTKVEVHGTSHERFAAVRETFAHQLDTGQDIGASVAVFVDGEPVVDLWGGYFDATYTRPFERDTLVQGYSSTKTVTALCALVLADRGLIDLDAPVARYWPEFAAEGKAGVAVRQLLGHTSGLCGWDVPMTFRDLAIGFTPNRWISGPHETDRSRSLIQVAYESLRPGTRTRSRS